jgi:DNA-binding MarR family transcriptional regulator
MCDVRGDVRSRPAGSGSPHEISCQRPNRSIRIRGSAEERLDRPGLSQRELAEAMTIARPTATRALDGLEARKLIKRRAGDVDGREQRIHPTAEAEAIRDRLHSASGNVTRRLKLLLGPQAFEQTVSKIRAVRTAIGRDST